MMPGVRSLTGQADVKERAKHKAAESKERVVDTAQSVGHVATEDPRVRVPLIAVLVIGAFAVGVVVGESALITCPSSQWRAPFQLGSAARQPLDRELATGVLGAPTQVGQAAAGDVGGNPAPVVNNIDA